MAAALQILFMRRHLRRERIFRDLTNPMDIYNDDELIRRYRFPRQEIFDIVNAVRRDIERPTKRSKAISPLIQVLTTLRFLTKGDYQSETGDIHSISTSSCSRVIQPVCRAICNRIDSIKFPTTANDLNRVKEGFYNIAGFPNVIGTIDGTLIPIQGMGGDDERNFVSRKGYHAINVQAVADHQLRFTNVVIRWAGGTHDAFILQQSALLRYMETNADVGWLLGDSGYPLKVWLITPLGIPVTQQQQRFNNSHCRTRNTVERAFGVLKQRFRCLHKTGGALSYKPSRSIKIIESCFRLHNLAVQRNIPLNRDRPLPLIHHNHVVNQRNIAAQALRNEIINRF